jgi:uncharacterized protein YegL
MAAPIPGVEFRRNKAERLPCVLVVDGSSSMVSGDAIGQLNDALKIFADELKADEDVSDSVQIAVLRMGDDDDVELLSDFVDAADFVAPAVRADGLTPMGKAIDRAMQMLEEQKQRYRQNSITYKRPWLFVMSDGEPTDDWMPVAKRTRVAQEEMHFTFWAVGIGNLAPLTTLKEFCVGERCFRLGERKFKEMFEWLADSLRETSRKALGDQVALTPPPAGVFTIDT